VIYEYTGRGPGICSECRQKTAEHRWCDMGRERAGSTCCDAMVNFGEPEDEPETAGESLGE
jgi:hypothetical protein